MQGIAPVSLNLVDVPRPALSPPRQEPQGSPIVFASPDCKVRRKRKSTAVQNVTIDPSSMDVIEDLKRLAGEYKGCTSVFQLVTVQSHQLPDLLRTPTPQEPPFLRTPTPQEPPCKVPRSTLRDREKKQAQGHAKS